MVRAYPSTSKRQVSPRRVVTPTANWSPYDGSTPSSLMSQVSKAVKSWLVSRVRNWWYRPAAT